MPSVKISEDSDEWLKEAADVYEEELGYRPDKKELVDKALENTYGDYL